MFFNRNYVKDLSQIVESYKIPPQLIILEILENVAADSIEIINNRIEELHLKGFRVSMDDFGSGYSSLNMLYQLKIDGLKLDKGFFRKLSDEGDKRRKIILEHIILIAKKLGIYTVAEGIETEKDREAMKILSCDYGQDYLYSKPLSAEDFSEKYMF